MALHEFTGADLNVDDALRLMRTKRLGFGVGFKPNRVEVLLRVNGVEFDPAFARAVVINADGLVLHVIHPYDQIRNKRPDARLKDLADVEMLVKRHGDPGRM